jgi:hypothetical protein
LRWLLLQQQQQLLLLQRLPQMTVWKFIIKIVFP